MIARANRGICTAILGNKYSISRLMRNYGATAFVPEKHYAAKAEKVEKASALELDWFPMKLSDIDLIGNKLMVVGQGPNSDHPSYTDKAYRARREEIGGLGIGHKMGNPIRKANYTQQEHDLWRHIYTSVRPLHEQVYCREYLKAVKELENIGIFKPDRVPELDDLNNWLLEVSDWRVKPVGGILTQREFLNCLAFRTFCSAQYLRHPAMPDFTPEPDIMHEFIGHIPGFADQKVCELSQKLGELSLGATDQQVEAIGTIYWYTIEFGLCKQGDDFKIYGAGPAGSVAQLTQIREQVKNNRQSIRKLDLKGPPMPSDIEDEDLQNLFYAAENFDDFINQINDYTKTFERKFKLSLNRDNLSYTCDRELRFRSSN